MASIYDRTELYDLFDTPDRQAVYREHWHTLFAGKQVHTMLDVSIGSGSVTLPALELNVSLCGSDLSEPMLTACRATVRFCRQQRQLARLRGKRRCCPRTAADGCACRARRLALFRHT